MTKYGVVIKIKKDGETFWEVCHLGTIDRLTTTKSIAEKALKGISEAFPKEKYKLLVMKD